MREYLVMLLLCLLCSSAMQGCSKRTPPNKPELSIDMPSRKETSKNGDNIDMPSNQPEETGSLALTSDKPNSAENHLLSEDGLVHFTSIWATGLSPATKPLGDLFSEGLMEIEIDGRPLKFDVETFRAAAGSRRNVLAGCVPGWDAERPSPLAIRKEVEAEGTAGMDDRKIDLTVVPLRLQARIES